MGSRGCWLRTFIAEGCGLTPSAPRGTPLFQAMAWIRRALFVVLDNRSSLLLCLCRQMDRKPDVAIVNMLFNERAPREVLREAIAVWSTLCKVVVFIRPNDGTNKNTEAGHVHCLALPPPIRTHSILHEAIEALKDAGVVAIDLQWPTSGWAREQVCILRVACTAHRTILLVLCAGDALWHLVERQLPLVFRSKSPRIRVTCA